MPEELYEFSSISDCESLDFNQSKEWSAEDIDKMWEKWAKKQSEGKFKEAWGYVPPKDAKKEMLDYDMVRCEDLFARIGFRSSQRNAIRLALKNEKALGDAANRNRLNDLELQLKSIQVHISKLMSKKQSIECPDKWLAAEMAKESGPYNVDYKGGAKEAAKKAKKEAKKIRKARKIKASKRCGRSG